MKWIVMACLICLPAGLTACGPDMAEMEKQWATERANFEAQVSALEQNQVALRQYIEGEIEREQGKIVQFDEGIAELDNQLNQLEAEKHIYTFTMYYRIKDEFRGEKCTLEAARSLSEGKITAYESVLETFCK